MRVASTESESKVCTQACARVGYCVEASSMVSSVVIGDNV
jgi:hypothetical protein